MGMSRSGLAFLAGQAAGGESSGRPPFIIDVRRAGGRAIKRAGRKMAATGNDPRLAAMLVNAGEGDSAATAAMLAAILRTRREAAVRI